MTVPGDYTDTFRALGRFLEMVGAAEISILDHGDHTEVSWRGKRNTREERRYQESELQALRTAARLFRGTEGGSPTVTLSELLRTIGRDMDDAGATDVALVETSNGFYVTANFGEERLSRLYTTSEIIARAREQHADRLADQGGAPASAPSPPPPAESSDPSPTERRRMVLSRLAEAEAAAPCLTEQETADLSEIRGMLASLRSSKVFPALS